MGVMEGYRAGSIEDPAPDKNKKLLQFLGRVAELPKREVQPQELLLAANLRGLVIRHRQAKGLEHVPLAHELDHMGEDIQEYFNNLEQDGTHKLQLSTGTANIRPRLLSQNHKGYYLDELSFYDLPQNYQMPITYVRFHRSPPEDLPPEAHYYPLNQLYLGNHQDGVIPLFALGSILSDGGGELKPVAVE